MKNIFYLTGILGLALFIRLWHIGIVPPLLNNTPVTLRLLSVLLSVGSACLLYRYLILKTGNKKICLLGVWVFAVFPWVIDQGRIVSQANSGLFLFLLLLVLIRKTYRMRYKLVLFLIFLPFLFIVYPDFWFFRSLHLVPLSVLLTNMFSLTSFEFLFFHNTSFWWGSLRDWGIMHLTFLPPLVIGLYETFHKKEITIILWLSVITFISAASPYFPESREFFIAIPFLSFIVALGLYRIGNIKGNIGILLRSFVVLLFIYDFSLYLHLYFVHYPIQVIEGLSKIKGLY
jgi:hypothetical protein